MNYLGTRPLKDKGIAVILALLLGPIGLFYATIKGGIIMTFLMPILIFVLLFFGMTTGSTSIIVLAVAFCIFYNIFCIIWAVKAVSKHNAKVIEEIAFLNQSNQSNLSLEDDLLNARNDIYEKMERLKNLHDQGMLTEYDYKSQNLVLLNKLDKLKQNENSFNTANNDHSQPLIIQKKSNFWIWFLAILLILSLVYLMYDDKSKSLNLNKITNIFNSNSKDEEDIKKQIENTYFGIMSGAYTAQNMSGIGSEGLPFYNQNLQSVFAMGLAPFAQILGGFKVETKNIDVYKFQDKNTAQVKYDLIISNLKDPIHIDMIVKKIGGNWKLDAEKAFGEKGLKKEKSTTPKRKLVKSISINASEIFNKKNHLYKVKSLNQKNEKGEYELIPFEGDKSFLITDKFVYEIDHGALINKWKIKEVVDDGVDVYEINVEGGIQFAIEGFLVKSSPWEEVSYGFDFLPASEAEIKGKYINP